MLGLSRSNVSTALKELKAWGLVTAVRGDGTRRETLTVPSDPWEVLHLVLAGRRRRISAPLLDRLLADAGTDPRIAALAEAAGSADRWFGRTVALDPGSLAAKLGGADKKDKKRKKKD